MQWSRLLSASQFYFILLVLTFLKVKAMSKIIAGKFFTALGDLNKSHAEGTLVHGMLALGEIILLSIISHILGQAVHFFLSFLFA